MPDNVSLSVSDINDLKSNTDLALSLLNKKNFVFDSEFGKPEKFSIIGSNGEKAIKIFAAIKGVTMTGNSKTVDIPLDGMSSNVTPSIQVTVSGDPGIAKYRLTTSAHVTKSKITVYIEANPKSGVVINAGSGKLSFELNVLAIGYA